MKNRQILKRLILIPILLILFSSLAFFIYMGDYYHEDEKADQAMDSYASVEVTDAKYGYFFDGKGNQDALVFYPGAKVDEKAYAPLMHRLAENGIDCFLVKMPFHFALLDIDKADQISDLKDYDHVYIAGHSLGGVVASIYASGSDRKIDGIVFLASYPDKKVDENIRVLSIYGSNDQVLNLKKYEESKEYISGNLIEYVIEGGNHSQFGSYGSQKGDGQALISMEEQIDQTVDLITAFILGG